MPDWQQLVVFIFAGWLLNLTPGPDVLYITRHALRGGWRAGFIGALGITCGCLVHVIAAALGVSALMTASSTAFTLLKWLGAAYLVWIGMQMLMSRTRTTASRLGTTVDAELPAQVGPIFLGGFWTNVLNPKVALFFLAFLPQFIAPDASDKSTAFLLLGLLFIVNSVPVNAGWALMAAWMARRATVQRNLHWVDRIAGGMFVAFGMRLVLSD